MGVDGLHELDEPSAPDAKAVNAQSMHRMQDIFEWICKALLQRRYNSRTTLTLLSLLLGLQLSKHGLACYRIALNPRSALLQRFRERPLT